MTLDDQPSREVPCNGCTLCCQGDAIFIHPECGDEPNDYHTELLPDGRRMLQHRANRDCIYLDRTRGCQIHSRRPVVCRELDCRLLATEIQKHPFLLHGIGNCDAVFRKGLAMIEASENKKPESA